MKRLLLFFTLIFPFSVLYSYSDSLKVMKSVIDKLKNEKVLFLENKGQMKDMNHLPVPFVLFKAETNGVNLYITETGLTYSFIKLEKCENVVNEFGIEETEENMLARWERVDVILKNATIKRENIIKENPSSTNFNYYLAHCQDGIKNVNKYEKITIQNVYPNIDWVFYNSSEKGFKYDFVVRNGANPAQIKLVYSTLHPFLLKENGAISINTKYGNLNESAPYSFMVDSKREVESNYIIEEQKLVDNNHYETIISFSVNIGEKRNLNETLVIDPDLVWATYYGGANEADGPSAIDLDSDGNIFITGYTQSTDFPVQDNGTYFMDTLGGLVKDDFIVMKFSSAGILNWCTYYGGIDNERANSIKVDSDGEVFVTGYGKSTVAEGFPYYDPGGTAYFDNSVSSSLKSFYILKFDNEGNRLWATAFGSSTSESSPFGMAINSSDEVYIVGYTFGNHTTIDELDQGGSSFYDGTANGTQNGLITKFANDGTQLWTTFFGGNSSNIVNAIAIDAEDNVIITGYTTGSSPKIQLVNPGGGAYYDNTYDGAGDAFITKFNSNDSMLWSTYYGGTGQDIGRAIATDDSLNIFIIGATASTDFPLLDAGDGAYYQSSNAGGVYDAFISKFSKNGVRTWSTYYGGSQSEFNPDVSNATYGNAAINSCGHLYVSFDISSSDITTQDLCIAGGYYDNSYNTVADSNDTFLAAFSNQGHLLWGSYFGGNGESKRCPIVIDDAGSLFVTGEWSAVGDDATYSLTDLGGGAYYDATFNGGVDDGFIAKFTNDLAPCPCRSYLPISLLSFTGECTNGQINLKWTTATEVNNNFFTIEKSKDVITWDEVARISGAGNSSVNQNYSLTDMNSHNGVLYYRLKQTDFDGKYEYFDVLALSCENYYQLDVVVYPSPNDGNFIITGFRERAEIFIFNALGETVYKSTVNNSEFSKIDLTKQAKGIYSIVVNSGGKSVIKKISIK